MSTTKTWRHRPGDTYRVVLASAWANEQGNGIRYDVQPTKHDGLADAISEGFTEHDRSGDFNVGVWENGKLVALLWMNEIVESHPIALHPIALAEIDR